jgi:enediyne biosynthesis protein E4
MVPASRPLFAPPRELCLFRPPLSVLLVAAIAPAVCGCAPRPAGPPPPPRSGTSVTAPPGLFENATEKAGITFRHTNGDTPQYKFIETFGGGCAFFDYDNDGFLDLVFVNSGNLGADPKTAPPNLTIYRNRGDASFEDVTKGSGLDVYVGYGQGVAVGDFDNDGKSDLFVAAYGGCRLFRNVTGGGAATSFVDVTAQAGVAGTERGPRWASGAAFGDYDNDGLLDLYVARYAVWAPETDKKCPRPDGSPGYCVPTVYDGDAGALYRNLGNGKFQDVSKRSGIERIRGRSLAVAWIDYDDDGKPDLYVANDLDPNHLIRNNGDGTFTDVAAIAGAAMGIDGQAMSGMGIAAGDYDRSGRESLFVTNLNGEVFSLFRNEGRGQFTYASHAAGLREATIGHSAWGTAFFDFDRDGWPDLVTANGNVDPNVASDLPGVTYEEPKSLFRNQGDGRFEDVTSRSGALNMPRASRGLAIGDYDNDGRLDIACVNRNERADLFRNVSPDAGRWISLKLVGTKSNRDGSGAKVRLTSGAAMQYQECRLGSSYAGSSDKRLFFGLGASTKADRVEIRWPSGQRQTVVDLAAGKTWVVTEGKGHAAAP